MLCGNVELVIKKGSTFDENWYLSLVFTYEGVEEKVFIAKEKRWG